MKALSIAVLIALSSVVAFAGEDEPKRTGFAVVRVKGSEIFKVIYKGESAGKVKLNVYKGDGSLLFTENINGLDGFICPLNFSGLGYGEYTIELVDGDVKKAEKVSYLPATRKKYVHVSKVFSEEGKYLLSVVNDGADVISVKIYDSKNNLLHDEATSVRGDYAKVYKINANESSSYTFEVSDSTGNLKTVKL